LVKSILKQSIIKGVADGVGGWRNKGVDPSLISNQLMKNAQQFVEEDINKQANEGT